MSPPLHRRCAVVLIITLATVLSVASPASAGSGGPATPTALWASTTGTGISLTWEQPRAGTPATSFRVYESDEVVARVGTTATNLEVPFGSSHTYTVAAVDHRGRESARTAPVTGRSWLYGYNPECMSPSAVSITVIEVTSSAAALSWSRHPLGGDLELRVDGRSLGWTSSTSARVGGLTPGTSHAIDLYRHNQCHTGGGGVQRVGSSTVTTLPGDPARPEPPSGLTVTGRTDSTIGLSWTAPAGTRPARYAVYDGATRVAATAGTAVTVDRLHPSTSHRFTVAALDAAGNESAHTTAVTAATDTCPSTPPRPVAVNAVATSPSSVRLSWVLETAATSYTVLDGDTPVATTRYPEAVLTGLASASRHTYRVIATLAQGCGQSPRSRPAAVVTPAGPASRPAAPAALTVTGNAAGTWPSGALLTLAWSPAPGETPTAAYRVYEGARLVGEIAGTSMTVPVGAATTHEYVVVAVDEAGHESAPSPRVTVRAMFMPPP